MRAALETLAGIGRSAPGAGPSRCWARCASWAPAPRGARRGRGARAPAGHRRGRGRRATAPGRSTTRCSRSGATTVRRATSTPSNRRSTWLRDNVAGPDVVLVKASRAGRLERVADALLGDGADWNGPMTASREEERRTVDESDPARRAASSLLFTLVGTRYAIRVLAAKGYGQLIRDDGPTTHHTKRGTPTMGGLVIMLASVLAYFLAKLITGNTPERLGAAAAVPVRRAGHRRLPRRLHQDRQAAQPRPAQPGQVRRPDLRRGGLRLAGALAVARGRPRPDPGRPRHLLHPRLRSFTLPTIVLVLFIW